MEDRLQSSERSGPMRPCSIRTEFVDPLNYRMETFGLIFRLDRFRAHIHMLPLVVNRQDEGPPLGLSSRVLAAGTAFGNISSPVAFDQLGPAFGCAAADPGQVS